MRRGKRVLAAMGAALVLSGAGAAHAATPGSGAITPDAQGRGQLAWTGSVSLGTALAAEDGEACFGTDNKPDAGSGCDLFSLDVNVPAGFYDRNQGTVEIGITGLGASDLDLYVYRRNADGTRGELVQGSGNFLGEDETVAITRAQGAYYVAVLPFTVLGAQDYEAGARLETRKTEAPPAGAAVPGFVNYRASNDQYTSHSEPTIAMDPLDHNHLIAGSKQYENNAKYLFKIGTYESFDGGRSWKDLGHLPGYCQEPGQCDPGNEAGYRTTSDVAISFDDEGNAYANVLDAPGGTFAFRGFNMTVHIKRPGQPWTGPITVHDNRTNPVSEQLFLDDKNWITVDNTRDVNGGPNRQRDGKTGPMYVCWSLDGATDQRTQSIVVMRSLDGGRTWGGLVPGDNTPVPVSQKVVIGGLGCQVAIGPQGQVYITWYDSQLDILFNVVSTNQGRTFSQQRPVAQIVGVNEPFGGQAFRNISIPTSGVDGDGNLYIAVASCGGEASLLASSAERGEELARKIKRGDLGFLSNRKEGEEDQAAPGTGACAEAPSSSDIVLFKSSDGGGSWSGPVKVNQDPPGRRVDQFQPWLALTPKGQVNVSYFDRRVDPGNYLIDTWLSRSNDGGGSFHDTRVSRRSWNPALNPPISVSGEFIGDYQGLVADDDVAIPFWNDTQLTTNLKPGQPGYSPYQEVFSARVPNGPASFVARPSSGSRLSARRGPASITLRGTATDPSGGTLRRVRVALLRQRGRRCAWYSRRAKGFRAGSCRRPRYLAARGTARWRASFRRRALRRGYRYSVLSSAVNTAGKSETPDERGRNRVGFRVRLDPARRH